MRYVDIPYIHTTFYRRSPRDVEANELNCHKVVSEFELQFCFYIHFQNKTFGKLPYSLSLS